ncbi:MAG: hypothetical protein A3B96_02650 [Candidatus Spechtbacteria bacterium RIFCSPHIGHO2_02_FULL_43_15b]|uniref:BioF2-like acetyltransferase domain-containing protein n=1 Tax=Candidatus Spechtbacteria bacterium RIFCSPHIGHO2_01_FULL_43_30 TaxID=1802158 RepID=A0A1G2H745_9BACT|nr:MAG: hypothetical protein A2827_02805 [Candidatus Spechtbacteria bacterium RIFCSPHIGHO2_01_FULL_43_30]OGZ60198.1 MAG: hypothetical protein A3B96_02650 [Candidatus Spechtbacteria bacterium RIFCSPHIGHO2_02_FULL_43_15b]
MEHFLQSPEWEEFQKSIGRKTLRVEGLLVIKLPLILDKSYLYAAGTRVADSKPITKGLVNGLAGISKNENAIFFKFEPMVSQGELAKELTKSGLKKSDKHIQPQRTVILDLIKSDEELLGDMREKARYNLRLASRKDLKFDIQVWSANEPIFEEFWRILEKTAERDAFHTHTKDYYQKLLEMPLTKLFKVRHDGKLISASIVLFYGDRAYYLHGASDYEYRNLMAPYLLHWETIKYAKSKGFREYDFWGVDDAKWPGVTRFKRGFGGKEIEYAGSYDYIFQPLWHKLYDFRDKIRKR